MYRIILFDVDDTLLDFKAGELKSLAKMFARLNLTYSPRIEASYLKINASLWRDYEAGRITRPELFDVRFAKLFRHHHIEADPHLAERTYHHFWIKRPFCCREFWTPWMRCRIIGCLLSATVSSLCNVNAWHRAV